MFHGSRYRPSKMQMRSSYVLFNKLTYNAKMFRRRKINLKPKICESNGCESWVTSRYALVTFSLDKKFNSNILRTSKTSSHEHKLECWREIQNFFLCFVLASNKSQNPPNYNVKGEFLTLKSTLKCEHSVHNLWKIPFYEFHQNL